MRTRLGDDNTLSETGGDLFRNIDRRRFPALAFAFATVWKGNLDFLSRLIFKSCIQSHDTVSVVANSQLDWISSGIYFCRIRLALPLADPTSERDAQSILAAVASI